jgi:hypothetical protein
VPDFPESSIMTMREIKAGVLKALYEIEGQSSPRD